jgi:alanyl-tRNA synthetase
VLRRILRRATRFADEKFHLKAGQMSSLVDVVVESLADAFPELTSASETIKEIIDEEEVQFRRTLSRGAGFFARKAKKVVEAGETVVPGSVVWLLYESYGFPSDLTQIMAEERNLTIDWEGYRAAQAHSVEVSKKRSGGTTTSVTLDVHMISELQNRGCPPTNDAPKYNYAKNEAGVYEFPTIQGKVLAIVHNKALVEEVTGTGETECGVVFDTTCMYAEQGGQEHDTGVLSWGDEQDDQQMSVSDVCIHGGYVLHVGELTGTLRVGEIVGQSVDGARREPIMHNHTATHLINYALRKVLGSVSDQKGSAVSDTGFRFDYSTNRGLSVEEIAEVDTIVNHFIHEKVPVNKEEQPLHIAKSFAGVRAMFGETYPDPVRVVAVGPTISELVSDPSREEWTQTSIEFCGGTHVVDTGDIKHFAVVSDEPIAKGIKRIEAVTGTEALQAVRLGKELEQGVKRCLGMSGSDFAAAVNPLLDSVNKSVIPTAVKRRLRASLEDARAAFAKAETKGRAEQVARETARLRALVSDPAAMPPFVVERVSVDPKSLAQLIQLYGNAKKGIGAPRPALLVTADDATAKIYTSVSVPKTMTGQLKADAITRAIQSEFFPDGKCGGAATVAQVNGSAKGIDIDSVVEFARKEFAKLMS